MELRECLLLYDPQMLSFSFLPKIIDIKLHRTMILPVVLHVCET